MSSFLYKARGGIMAAIFLLSIGLGSGDPWMFWMIPLVWGILLRVWARCHIGMHSRGENLEVPVLSQSGPYALIRHPLYLSNATIAFGFLAWWMGICMQSIALTILVVVFYRCLAHWEDLHLEKTIGESWRIWKSQVPGVWCPRRIGTVVLFGDIQTLRQSVISDASTWFWLILVFTLLWILRYFHVA